MVFRVRGAWVLLIVALSAMISTPVVEGQETEWIKEVNGSIIALDKTGVYITGDKDKGYIISKYDKNGNELWTRQFGTIYQNTVSDISVDRTGIYIIGTLLKPIGQEVFSEAFIAKYDLYGNHVWTRLFGDNIRWDGFRNGTASVGRALSVHSSGIYMLGPRYRYSQSGIEHSAFLRKYDPAGNVVWTKLENGLTHISVHSSGVYVAGYTPSGSVWRLFIHKYDFSGNEAWARQFGTTKGDWANGIAVHDTGVYVAGMTEGVFRGQNNSGYRDAFVVKYDLYGNEIWTRQFGATLQVGGKLVRFDKEDSANGITVDSTGVYVTGHTYGELPGQNGGGPEDPFVRKYDFNGNELWTWQFGSGDNDRANQVAVDESGVYVAGGAGWYEGPCCPKLSPPFIIKLSDKSRPPAPIWRCILEGIEPFRCGISTPLIVLGILAVAAAGAVVAYYGRRHVRQFLAKSSTRILQPLSWPRLACS